MKKYRAFMSIGFPTAKREEEFEFEDDATEAEIEQEVRDWMENYLEWGFYEIEEKE